jgi:hypothetical protein
MTIASPPLTKYWTRPDGPDRLGRQLAGPGKSPAAIRAAAGRWLPQAAEPLPDAATVFEALAWASALPRIGPLLPPELRHQMVDRLLGVAGRAEAIDPHKGPLLCQLSAGELALTLACRVPEVRRCRSLKRLARHVLMSGLVQLLDGEGLPHARHIEFIRPLLACWTRCRLLGEQIKGGCWSRAAERQYGRLVRNAVRLARYDGTHAFSDGPAGDDAALLAAALGLCNDGQSRRIARLALPRQSAAGRARATGSASASRKNTGKASGTHRRRLPAPATHSEQAATAVLRSSWSQMSDRLTVLYAGQTVRMELAAGRELLCSGTWQWEVLRDGLPALPISCWEAVCWVSDADVDYLELQIDLAGPLRLERHILLARQDRFLMLADAILGNRPARLEYRSCLPLCPKVAWRPAAQTREGFLISAKKRLAMVVPLALPEWHGAACDGELAGTADTTATRAGTSGLQLQQAAQGRRMFAPLWLDLDRRRIARRLTWRRLTVAEAAEVQPADVAVGYRLALGKQQWLMYRSLAKQANRTLLGHNLSTETLVARFQKDGQVQSLIEIE